MQNQTMQFQLKPGMPAPALSFKTLTGDYWNIKNTEPTGLDLIAVYRGLFCPYCRGFISALASQRESLGRLGITPIAVSMDDESKARQTKKEWNLGDMTLGYDVGIDDVRAWNIFLTTREQAGQMVTFCEPALLMVNPQKQIYAMILQSIPSGRPDLQNLLEGLEFLAKQGFPIRGSA